MLTPWTSTVSLILASLLYPVVSAVGSATVFNGCKPKICVYTTTPGGGSVTNTYVLKKGGSVTVPYPPNGMVGSQVRVSPDCDLGNVVYWEFAQGNNIIYYDVNINGPTSDPFVFGLSITGSSSSCPKITCAAGGSTSCFNYPNGNPQNQVKACNAVNNIYFNACVP